MSKCPISLDVYCNFLSSTVHNLLACVLTCLNKRILIDWLIQTVKALFIWSQGRGRNCWRGVFTFFPFPPFCSPSLSLPYPFLPLPSLPLRSSAPLNQLGSLRSDVTCSAGSGAEPGRKRIWCTHRAARKPLATIILSILKCMFHIT